MVPTINLMKTSKIMMILLLFSLRLRKKTWKNPGTVYVDTQTFDEDISIYANFEVFVEQLDGKNAMVILCLFVCLFP